MPAESGVGTFIEGPAEDWSGTDPASTLRWYPTATSLGDGSVLITDGAVTASRGRPTVPVIFKSALTGPFSFTGWEPLEIAEYCSPTYNWDIPYYPFMVLLKNGDVFLAGGHYFDLGSPGAQPLVSRRLDPSMETWTDVADLPIKGGSVVKLLYRDDPNPVKDLVMIAGGGLTGHQGPSCDDNVVSSGAHAIDFTAAMPAWSALASMAHARIHFYLVALPDGTVLAVGGARGDGPGGTLPPLCDSSNDILEPEIYNPYSNTWSPMASMATPRLYHSSALLLRDGSVFVAGGERQVVGSATVRHRNYEIFKPPYFFRYASRPTITSSPVSVKYNKGFDVGTPDVASAASVTKVRLIRTGAASHSFDHNGRMLELEFSVKQSEPEKLRVKSPQHGDLAPPGYYLMYICTGTNGQNPSEGVFLKLDPIGTLGGP